MFEHSDRRDLVEGAIQFAVISKLHRGKILQLLPFNNFIDKLELPAAQCTAKSSCPKLAGRVADQSTPTAANIQHPLTRAKNEYLAMLSSF